MAGLIAALFGGKRRPDDDPNATAGIGGYSLPPGPAGQSGFPGSTHQTRTFKGNNPRVAKVRADTNTGFEQAPGTEVQVRQASYRGDNQNPIAATYSPRATEKVATRQPLLTQLMQQTPGTFFGGPLLKTGEGNQTAGGQPLSGAQAAGGHSVLDSQTPWREAQPVIGTNVPGSNNVRNQVAQRYKNPAGQVHTYKSAPRADQAPVNRGGQTTDGNVHPERVVQDVSVLNRFVYPGGGNTTWSVLREMPYAHKGNGKRGADLNGQRRYATGQEGQFVNAGMGDYGVARQLGNKRPVGFDQPGPWTANYYDTTSGVYNGTQAQAPDTVYVSPATGRASNSTGRTS